MKNTLLIIAALFAGTGIALAQEQVPGNKSEGAAPAPPAQQNAPPDKLMPGPSNSPNAVPSDAKAEVHAPALNMESDPGKKLTTPEGVTSGQDKPRPGR